MFAIEQREGRGWFGARRNSSASPFVPQVPNLSGVTFRASEAKVFSTRRAEKNTP